MKKYIKQSGLHYRLKTFKNGKWTTYPTQRRKLVFRSLVEATPAEKWAIKVTYKPTVYNEGIYDNRKDLMKAYEAFTEEKLIKYALENY